MKKLLSMLGAIGLVATSSATVVSCGDKDEVKVLDLAKTKNEINVVGAEGTDPSKEDILKSFNTANKSNLELTKDVTIDAITVDATVKTKYTATITAVKDDKLATGTGTLTITLVAAPVLDLSKTTNKIDVVGAAGTDPTKEDILKSFNTANKSNLELTKDVTIDAITVDATVKTKYTATITAVKDDKLATGTGTLTITLVAAPIVKVALSDLIKTLAIGEIADVQPETILASIIATNVAAKDLKITDVSIVPDKEDATAVNAVVTGLKDSTIVTEGSTVTVTFTVKAAA